MDTFEEKLHKNYYSTHTKHLYPKREDYVLTVVDATDKVDKSGFKGTVSELHKELNHAISEGEQAYKKAKKDYGEEEQELHAEFKKDLFKHFGVSEHPKKDVAFGMAWDRGHSSGYREVYQEFQTLTELL